MPAKDSSVSSVFSVLSALEALCDNALYKLTLTLMLTLHFECNRHYTNFFINDNDEMIMMMTMTLMI